MEASTKPSLLHPFKCYLIENGARGEVVGTSASEPSAVAIACAVWAAVSNYNPLDDRVIEVVDYTNVVVAAIGTYERLPHAAQADNEEG